MNHCHYNYYYYYYLIFWKGKTHTHTHVTESSTKTRQMWTRALLLRSLLATAQKHLQRLLHAGRSTVARISHELPPREAPTFDDYAKRQREQSKQSKMMMKKKKLFFLHFLPSREEALTQLREFNHKILVGFSLFGGVKFVELGGWLDWRWSTNLSTKVSQIWLPSRQTPERTVD